MSYRAKISARRSVIARNVRDHVGPASIKNSWPNWVINPAELETTTDMPPPSCARAAQVNEGRGWRSIPDYRRYVEARVSLTFGQRAPRIYKAKFRTRAELRTLIY